MGLPGTAFGIGTSPWGISPAGLQAYPQQTNLPYGVGTLPLQQIAQLVQIVPQQLHQLQMIQQQQLQLLQQLIQLVPVQVQQLQQLLQLIPLIQQVQQVQQPWQSFGLGTGLSPQAFTGQASSHVM